MEGFRRLMEGLGKLLEDFYMRLWGIHMSSSHIYKCFALRRHVCIYTEFIKSTWFNLGEDQDLEVRFKLLHVLV